jgi:hypothetical protein
MGNWKGFYLTATPGSPMRKAKALIAGAKRNLGLSKTAPHKLVACEVPVSGATGYAVLSAPRLRFLKRPPLGALLAVIYAKRAA